MGLFRKQPKPVDPEEPNDDGEAAPFVQEDNPYFNDVQHAVAPYYYMESFLKAYAPICFICEDMRHVEHSFIDAIVVSWKMIPDKLGVWEGIAWELARLTSSYLDEENFSVDDIPYLNDVERDVFKEDESSHRNEMIAFMDAALSDNYEGSVSTLRALVKRTTGQQEKVQKVVHMLGNILMLTTIVWFQREHPEFLPAKD